MLIEIKDFRSEELHVGDLTYFKGTLLKVTRVLPYVSGVKPKHRGMSGQTIKFRKVGRLKLKPYILESNQRLCWDCGCARNSVLW